MDLQAQVQSNTDRIAALEARIPYSDGSGPLDMFKGKPSAFTPVPPDEDFNRIFGTVHVNAVGRVLTRWEEQTLNRRKAAWGGILSALPDSEALRALLDAWEDLRGTLVVEAITYKGAPAIVFPKLAGLGYGTPNCFVLSVEAIEMAYGDLKWTSNVIKLIDINRGAETVNEVIVAKP